MRMSKPHLHMKKLWSIFNLKLKILPASEFKPTALYAARPLLSTSTYDAISGFLVTRLVSLIT